MIRAYQPSTMIVADVQGRLKAEWVEGQTQFNISRQEMMRNRGKSKLIDLVKSRRIDALSDLANLLEVQGWSAPNSPSDDLNAWGIPYWLVKPTAPQTAAQTLGFQGGTYSTAFPDCGGIDPTQAVPDASRWKSYNGSWTNSSAVITDDDIANITDMMLLTEFTPPQFVTDINAGNFSKRRFYSGRVLRRALEDRARKVNDNYGADVGKYAGGTLIMNTPVKYVPYLDNDTTYPLYMINHAYFKAFIMAGEYLREEGPMNSRDLHNVWSTFYNLSFNFLCTNRRMAGGVIAYTV
jgi:hypothetical protein